MSTSKGLEGFIINIQLKVKKTFKLFELFNRSWLNMTQYEEHPAAGKLKFEKNQTPAQLTCVLHEFWLKTLISVIKKPSDFDVFVKTFFPDWRICVVRFPVSGFPRSPISTNTSDAWWGHHGVCKVLLEEWLLGHLESPLTTELVLKFILLQYDWEMHTRKLMCRITTEIYYLIKRLMTLRQNKCENVASPIISDVA